MNMYVVVQCVWVRGGWRYVRKPLFLSILFSPFPLSQDDKSIHPIYDLLPATCAFFLSLSYSWHALTDWPDQMFWMSEPRKEKSLDFTTTYLEMCEAYASSCWVNKLTEITAEDGISLRLDLLFASSPLIEEKKWLLPIIPFSFPL